MANQVADQVKRTIGAERRDRGDVWDTATNEPPPNEAPECQMRREDADEPRLRAHDDGAHLEAMAAPGFIHYFKGPLTPERACLSFCLWTSRSDARIASAQPAHRAAMGMIAEAYAHYTLEFYRARKVAGTLAWSFEPYDRAPAGSDDLPQAA